MDVGATPVVVRGGGELGSAVARLLFLTGFPVAVLERQKPLAVRRRVSFAEAVFSGQAEVEGVIGRLVPLADLGDALASRQAVAVAVDPEARALDSVKPAVLVDARMAKRIQDTRRDQAPLVVGLGPGFAAGHDVHAVVETQRGPDLGRVLRQGRARPDTVEPAPVLGHTHARVLRAPRGGVFRGSCAIGDLVVAGAAVGEVDGEPVVSTVTGLVRGLLADGVPIEAGTKVGDVDPRGAAVGADHVSDKGRTVAAGVLEVVLAFTRETPGSRHR